MNAVRIIYSTAYALGILGALPYFAFKGMQHGKYIGTARKRLYPLPLSELAGESPRIWIQAVSVGEVMIARTMGKSLIESGLRGSLFLSVTTKTGTSLAMSNPGPFKEVLPFPLDFNFSVRRAFNVINPDLLLLTEAELWPNLLFEAGERGIPIILYNGRITSRSHRGYRKVQWLYRPALKAVRHFCVREEQDRQRYLDLGVPETDVTVTGNIKYDIPEPRIEREEIRSLFGLNGKERLILAGSTMKGEEGIILEAFANLKKEFPDLRLLIAPRHPERCEEVKKILGQHGYACARRSRLPQSGINGSPVLLLDTIGELASFYAIADVAFIGGSLLPEYGGHSPLEPAAVGVPVVYGPHMSNFADISLKLEKKGAAIRLEDQDEIRSTIAELLNHRERGIRMGQKGLEVCAENRGAAKQTASIVRRYAKSQ
ncbi:3-deoxy-D-manno-octulosonic acid transferase [Acidobacteriota bacterium]